MIFLLKIIALFEDFHLDGLTSVNLIVGDNNTGKTSLLEAIYLLVKQPESFQHIIWALCNKYNIPENFSKVGYQNIPNSPPPQGLILI